MKNNLNLTLGILCLVSVVLTGCTVGPDYETPATPVPSAFKNGASESKGSACREDWWKLFKDSQLNKLVDAAHGQNRGLRASFQRVEQARSTIRVTRADLFPQIGTSPNFNRNHTSEEIDLGGGTGFGAGRTTSTYSLPVNAAWEIDLFGRVRRSTEASTADAQAQEEDFAAMRLSVESDVASSYFRIRALDREISLVDESVGLRQDSVKLVKERFDQGVVGELDLAQAKTQLAQSKAEIAALRRQRSQYENALALLVGAPASSFSLGGNPLSGTPPRIPSGLPSELLRARPDIRMAERNMAGDGARIGVATAAFYPSVTLVGNVGVSAAEVGNLFQSSAGAWVINPSVTLPVFQGFRNKANLERAEAAFEESRQTYEGTILTAISEVETHLAAWKYLRVQANAQSDAVRSAKRARSLTTEQYNAGLVDYLFVLDAERTALTTERALASLTGDDYVNAVNLIRSLGGRW